MFNLLEFSGSFKNILTFLGLFFVIISVLSILFFFRPKASEKIEKECCLVENPIHFFNLDCITVFNKLCSLHKVCVWDFVDSIPKCVKVIILFIFFILKYTIKLSISFLVVYQPTIAKMDNFSLLQIIERIPELRFKYMGSYFSDTVPQLTKYSFAIINSAPSNDRGEHWIMIARPDKSYYFADSLGRKRSTYPFLTKSFDEWFLESYKD